MSLKRFADLLICKRLDLIRKVGVPVHCSAVMSLAGNATDKFTILRAADFLSLKPARLRGGDFGVAEAVPHDLRHFVAEGCLDFRGVLRSRYGGSQK